MNISTSVILGCLLVVTGCNRQTHISSKEKVQIIKEIKERLAGYPEALKRNDLAWFNNFWSKENFAIAIDGYVATDYDKWFKEHVPTDIQKVLYFNFTNGHAEILTNNIVSYTTNFDWGVVTIKNDTFHSRGSVLYMFKKYDGQWRVFNCAGTHQFY